jgi:hypothetical protein
MVGGRVRHRVRRTGMGIRRRRVHHMGMGIHRKRRVHRATARMGRMGMGEGLLVGGRRRIHRRRVHRRMGMGEGVMIRRRRRVGLGMRHRRRAAGVRYAAGKRRNPWLVFLARFRAAHRGRYGPQMMLRAASKAYRGKKKMY